MGKLNRNIFKLLVILFFKFLEAFAQDYNLGVCADAECSVPLAVGITTISYNPPDGSRLGFLPNQEVIVYVREYGLKRELLGVELNGRKGYVPKNFVRETKSLAKATVPAQLEFMLTRTRSFVYHETSHLHLSSNIPPGDNQNFIQTSVPNNFNPQHTVQALQHSEMHIETSLPNSLNLEKSMQAVQHSEVHLESSLSGHSDHGHFHASSDLYIAKNADSKTFIPQSETVNHQSSYFDSSSHSHFGSEALNFVRKEEMFPNFDNSIQSHSITHPPQSQWQNPSTQFHSQPNNAHGTFSNNMKKNFDPQSNNLFHSQRFDPQSNVLHHTQAPHTTPQLMTQNQMFTQSLTQPNVPPLNNLDKGYDETMALLQSQGYNSAGELTNQIPNQQYSEKQSTSFQRMNAENSGSNTDFHGKKPSMQSGQDLSLVNSDQSKHASSMVTSNQLGQIPSMVTSNQLRHNPSMVNSDQLSHSSSMDNSNQNNINDPSLKINDLQQVVNTLFEGDISITPSEPVVAQESSTFQFNKRLAAKLERITKLAESIASGNSELEGQSIVDDISEEEDEEDYVDYENIYSSKSIKTPLLEKSEMDLTLGMRSEQSTTVGHEQLTSKSEAEHDKGSMQIEGESKIETVSTSTTTVSTDSANEFLFNDTVSTSDLPEKKTETENHDTLEKEIGNIETNQETEKTDKGLSHISSNEVEHSNDGSSHSSKLLEINYSESFTQDKENNSRIVDDLFSEDEDFVIDNKENLVDVKTVDDAENVLSENVNGSDSFGLSGDSLLNVSDVKETENLLNAYQTRHLKDVESEADSFSSNEETEQTGSSFEFDIYIAVENTFLTIRAFVDAIIPWIPEPLYTIIMDLEKEGISPKVTVFTAISAIPCIILIVSLVFLKGKSKENKLNERLTVLERNFYNINAEKIILEEKLEKAEVELQISRSTIEEEKILSFKSKTEIECLKQQLEETTLELEKNVDEVDTLKGREHKYIELIHDHEKEHLNLLEQKGEVENKVLEFEETLAALRESLLEKDEEIQKLLAEKSEYRQANEIYEEKVSQLQKNCNQLLQEAEVWNLRVKELSEELSQGSLKREELEKFLQEKDIEIESLSEAVRLFKTFEEIGADNEECKTSEEKLKYLKNSTHNLMKLQKQEEENRLLAERLTEAKNRLLDIEVAIMDVKSENDKLKVNYNQALQDKAEAQTKLEVLTNYFKDKEIQMQRQLGVQEAVRQKTEEDASSAERRICLIEQENSSYKYQVASMKQEIEETERNLKSQIALQEKKAHENWLAARTAERKLEDSKQEVMQLRQRLTLLEREQENWSNSTRDEIIRPVPKRIGNLTDDSINSQDGNNSLEHRPNPFPPPPPMMLPSDRPLPPLPPLPPFLPPYERPPPFEPPPFRPQPWNMPPPDSFSNPDFRMTPDYGRGRESTPPRGRNSAHVDGELGPRQSSPITDLKDSRNSTPPHLLPDFHDIPPHPSRPFYPPPPMGPRTRYPMPPRFPPNNFRRDYPGPRRIDNQEENISTYGSQNAPVPPEDWHSSNTRV